MEVIIKAVGMTKIVGKNEVIVNNLTFDVREGEIVGLLGHNGAGKTTTFKMLLGLVNITKGEAYINGKKVPSKESRIGVGFLPELQLHPAHLTVYEYIKYYCKIVGKCIEDKELEGYLRKVGMYEAKDKLLISCSKGMRQRADIARLLALNCKVLMLDEPFSGLDPSGQLMLKNILLAMKKEGKTIVVNSHAASTLDELVDRVIFMKKGEIVAQGKLDELLSTNQVQIKFIKPSNFEEIKSKILDLINNYKPLSFELSEETIDLIVTKDQDLDKFLYESFSIGLKLQSLTQVRMSLDQYFVKTIGYTD